MAQPQVFKARLRRLNIAPTRLSGPILKADLNQIDQNLTPLRQNTSKSLAQTLYYQKHPQHQSPLVKNERAPVHQRLGVKQMRSRRLVPLGTNTSSVLPKKRGFRPPRPHLQHKQHKLQRLYTAQSRLERIRAQNLNSQRLNNNGGIKLRRLNNGLPPATNLTVEVKNPNFVPNGTAFTYQNGFRKFKMILNSQIQEEILEIQRENAGSIGTLPPMTTITPVTTEMMISERFGLL